MEVSNSQSGFIRARDREEWLVNRTKGIGASEVASILGVDKFRSAFQVWAEKTGNAPPEDLSGNEAVEFGCRLERPIAEAYAARTGRTVEMWPQFQIAVHAYYPWLRCTPDATQLCESLGPGLVQIKTTHAFNAAEWEDGPPLAYQVQVQAEMAVMNSKFCTLVCLVGGQKLRYHDVMRNDKFIESMIATLADFWAAVLSKEPVAVDGSVATTKVLSRLYPADNDELVQLSIDAMKWTAEIEDAKATIKEAQARKTLFENMLKAEMKDATYGIMPDGSRWSWKTQHRKGYVVEPTEFRVLRRLSG